MNRRRLAAWLLVLGGGWSTLVISGGLPLPVKVLALIAVLLDWMLADYLMDRHELDIEKQLLNKLRDTRQ